MNRYSTTTPSRTTWMLGGMALGALAMYLADPDRGNRRRAIARDKLRSTAVKTGNAIDAARRDLANRAHGLRAEANRMLSRQDMSTDDQTLIARMRQKMGRVVSHPHAIEVLAQQGCITLRGPVLAHEKPMLLAAARKVPGVASVEDMLEVHERPEGVPSLQGSPRPGRIHASMMPNKWKPSQRALAMMGGGALSMFGFTRRNPVSMLCAAAGLGLMTRAVVNMPFSHMAGMGGEKQAVDLQKSIYIEAQPETVFDLWNHYENFPHFMSNVQEVRDLGNGRSHWVVKGPAGAPVEWDSEITESRPGEILAWRSVPDSTVQHSGIIRFRPEGSGTRVSVHLSYSPPGGVVGHAVASLFSSDPKRQMDDDLMRMKSFIESGMIPHDAAAGQPMQPGQSMQPGQPGTLLH